MTTAIRALEKALGIKPSPATVALRQVMALSQIAASHLVHLYMMSLPDYYGCHSTAEMLPQLQEEMIRFNRLKQAVNAVTAELGGRALHPVAMTVAGFTRPPARSTLDKLAGGLAEVREDARQTLELFAGLEVPSLDNTAPYVALDSEDEYAVNSGRLVSSEGLDVREEEYSSAIAEEQVAHANAKRALLQDGSPLMVGALARFNLRSGRLHPEAKKAAAEAGFAAPVRNPFHNNLAQAVEIIHCLHECMDVLQKLPAGEPRLDIAPRAGQGGALTEAPRGLLYHSYALNGRGEVVGADIVTPTAHNFRGLEDNLRRLIEENIDAPQAEISRRCEQLVRAYDPCFSCSVH
jgi:coenzyme F420-reducing hydrogenase alpha subunit